MKRLRPELLTYIPSTCIGCIHLTHWRILTESTLQLWAAACADGWTIGEYEYDHLCLGREPVGTTIEGKGQSLINGHKS